ncbi:hypothetical protein E5P55_00060 [Candidatus Pinguicoccus supinus]|uniref:Uncharacterized protein n=1 Tax=Candidatus Pinguicoccus supinus TaxID=2529394 RepID=A0A7T0BRH5_9BACT|nr:hypothetical protein E5P55_00060 [Candidatus Pinguicoccus supinus]
MKNQVFLTKQLLNKLNFFFQQSFSKIKFTSITVLDIFAAKGSSLNIFTNRKPSRFVEMKFFLFEKNFSLKKNVIKNYYTVFSKAKHRRVFFYNVDVFKFDFCKLKN